MRAVLLLATLAVAAPACDSHFDARVGDAVLPQAYSVVPAGDGPTVVVRSGRPVELPASGRVKLAIDLAVPWSEVAALLARADAAHLETRPLVGQRHHVKGFVLKDHLALGPALQVRAQRTGKFCVAPPGSKDFYCLQSADQRHISSLFVREVMIKAVDEYGLSQVRVVADPELAWGDLVRSVDGIRSCCKQPVLVTVAR